MQALGKWHCENLPAQDFDTWRRFYFLHPLGKDTWLALVMRLCKFSLVQDSIAERLRDGRAYDAEGFLAKMTEVIKSMGGQSVWYEAEQIATGRPCHRGFLNFCEKMSYLRPLAEGEKEHSNDVVLSFGKLLKKQVLLTGTAAALKSTKIMIDYCRKQLPVLPAVSSRAELAQASRALLDFAAGCPALPASKARLLTDGAIGSQFNKFVYSCNCELVPQEDLFKAPFKEVLAMCPDVDEHCGSLAQFSLAGIGLAFNMSSPWLLPMLACQYGKIAKVPGGAALAGTLAFADAYKAKAIEIKSQPGAKGAPPTSMGAGICPIASAACNCT